MNGKLLKLAAVISLGMFTIWTLAGCSKNNNTTSYQTDGTLTATIGGTAYSAKSYVIGAYFSSGGYFVVQGESIGGGDTTGIQLTIPYNAPVNLAISVDSSVYQGFAGLTYIKGSSQYNAYYLDGASHGYITLTTSDTVNHRIIGTFNGVLYNGTNSNDSVVITGGAFNSTYQVQ